MKPLNQTERTRRWGNFLGLYGALIVLTALCWWLSLIAIPEQTNVQQNQTTQEMIAYRRQLNETDKMLVSVEQGSLLTDNWLRNFYANTSALDQQFPAILYKRITNSYRQLAAEYENAHKQGDEEVQLINSQKIQLEGKKASLIATLASIGSELNAVAAKPGGGNKLPAVTTVVSPVIKAGIIGPFKPLLIKGSGEFGNNNPVINASAQLIIVRDQQVMLGVYFETEEPVNGTLAKITERKELYTAPPGYRIVKLSVPDRTPWRANYTDKTLQEEQITPTESPFTFLIHGNTNGLDIGATGGTNMSIQLKKPIKVELEKE